MAQVPRATAIKRLLSARIMEVYERHAADGRLSPREQEEMRSLLTLNHQADALIDESVAAAVSLIRLTSDSEYADEGQMQAAAWRPALAEMKELLKSPSA